MTPEQNGRRLADDIVKHVFLTENICILIKISLKFVWKGPIDNKSPFGSSNGLSPYRRQAITDGFIHSKGSVS